MTKNEYEKIVNNIIIPISNEILTSKNNELYHVIKLRKEFDDRLLNEINKLILFIQNNIVITPTIDRHKTSACLMLAIIKYSPFQIMKSGYNLENLFYANELLGIYSAISLLECYTPDLKISFPKTIYTANDVDPYIKTLCTSIYISKRKKQLKYDVSNIAQILYLLEQFSLYNSSQAD